MITKLSKLYRLFFWLSGLNWKTTGQEPSTFEEYKTERFIIASGALDILADQVENGYE